MIKINICLILFLISLIFISIAFVAPYNYATIDTMNSFHPPSRIHFFNQGTFSLRPFIYKTNKKINNNEYKEDKSKKYYIKLFIKGDNYKILGLTSNIHLFGIENDCKIYLLGTDFLGRDIFSRLMIGSAISFSIALLGSFLTIFLGLTIGAIAGVIGGFTDYFIMRLVDILLMIPSFYLLLAIRSALPSKINSIQIYILIIIVISFINWAGIARIIRGMVLKIINQDFILAAKLLGTSNTKIIFKHILPHLYHFLIIALCTSFPAYILAEASLSMLGLGIGEPYISLGMLLRDLLSIIELQIHYWLFYPAFFLILITFALNYLSDKLKDSLDPIYTK